MSKPNPKTKLKTVPAFATEDQEREFWATADSTEYVDWSKARAVTPVCGPVISNVRPAKEQ